MPIARSIIQGFIKSPILPAITIVGGWLRLDRLFEVTWRWMRRKRVRRLRPLEIQEAERVFGDTIPYEDIRIVERSPLALWIASLSRQVHLAQDKRLGVTIFYTIHFGTELQPDNADMPWLVHELTHVWQYVRRGPRYLADALQAQSEQGRDAYEIQQGLIEGWAWEQFSLEQQGEIARAFYKALLRDQDTTVYRPYIAVLRGSVPES
jgi:hypothetical protein